VILLPPSRRIRPPTSYKQRGAVLIDPYRFATGFQPDGADFDGTNDTLWTHTNFTGLADSKTGLVSIWMKVHAVLPSFGTSWWYYTHTASLAGLVQFYFFDNTAFGGAAANSVSVFVQGLDSALNPAVTLAPTVANMPLIGNWFHYLASWDTSTGDTSKCYVYINDVNRFDPLSSNTFVANRTIDYATSITGHVVGGSEDAAGTTRTPSTNAAMADFYFAPGQWLDLSVTANRRKFIDGTGRPVDLGSDGSTPTGTKPAFLLHTSGGESAANFATNRTGNGNFTVGGALTSVAGP
jgi:hypothetical protein